jgi:hypothetical protein
MGLPEGVEIAMPLERRPDDVARVSAATAQAFGAIGDIVGVVSNLVARLEAVEAHIGLTAAPLVAPEPDTVEVSLPTGRAPGDVATVETGGLAEGHEVVPPPVVNPDLPPSVLPLGGGAFQVRGDASLPAEEDRAVAISRLPVWAQSLIAEGKAITGL